MSNLLKSLRENEDCERIAHVISPTKNERMSDSLIRSFFEEKTSDSPGNQMSEFPALFECLLKVTVIFEDFLQSY